MSVFYSFGQVFDPYGLLTVPGQRVVGHVWSLTDVDAAVGQDEETAPAVVVVLIVVDACAVAVACTRLLAVRDVAR